MPSSFAWTGLRKFASTIATRSPASRWTSARFATIVDLPSAVVRTGEQDHAPALRCGSAWAELLWPDSEKPASWIAVCSLPQRLNQEPRRRGTPLATHDRLPDLWQRGDDLRLGYGLDGPDRAQPAVEPAQHIRGDRSEDQPDHEPEDRVLARLGRELAWPSPRAPV